MVNIEYKYQNGINYIEREKYDDAIEVFKKLNDYKDSQTQLIKAYCGAKQISDLFDYCKDNGLSFEDSMKNNGYTDVYNEYLERFRNYAGKYYWLDSYYLEVKIVDVNNWTFSITKIIGDSSLDEGDYTFSFENPEKYSSYSFYTEEEKILDYSYGSSYEFIKQ